VSTTDVSNRPDDRCHAQPETQRNLDEITARAIARAAGDQHQKTRAQELSYDRHPKLTRPEVIKANARHAFTLQRSTRDNNKFHMKQRR